MRVYRDRLGTVSVGPWWLRLAWTRRPFAFSVYAFRHRLLFKPIDYARAGQ